MRKSKPEQSNNRRYISCGHCIGGLVRIERSPGHFAMRQCQCMLAYKAGGTLNPDPTVVDFKSRSSGESEAA